MKTKSLFLALLAVPALALAPASATLAQSTKKGDGAKSGGGETVARVNGVAIPKARLDVMMQQQAQRGAPDNEQVRSQVRDELINREVVAQEAQRLGLAKNSETQTQMELARQEVLVGAYLRDFVHKNPVSDADIQKEYDRAKAQTGAKEYQARHILVETEDQAKDIIAQLKKGAKFEDLAAKNSKDPGTKDHGGELGWNVPGVFDKTFADAMTKLDKGKITETPVQTRFGWHVIQLQDVRDVKFPALADVKPRIQQQLVQHKIDEAVRGLRAKAKVE
ncbi:MAG: peptidylprolyl isomerase [Clostridia bacterium]